MFYKNETKYFESEYYENGYFALSGRGCNGAHYSYAYSGKSIESIDDFLNEINRNIK